MSVDHCHHVSFFSIAFLGSTIISRSFLEGSKLAHRQKLSTVCNSIHCLFCVYKELFSFTFVLSVRSSSIPSVNVRFTSSSSFILAWWTFERQCTTMNTGWRNSGGNMEQILSYIEWLQLDPCLFQLWNAMTEATYYTSRWFDFSCNCFSNSPFVSRSFTSNSFDLISSDS